MAQHHLLLLLYILHYPLSMAPCQLTQLTRLTHQSIKVHHLLIQCNYPLIMDHCLLALLNLLNLQSIKSPRMHYVLYASNALQCSG